MLVILTGILLTIVGFYRAWLTHNYLLALKNLEAISFWDFYDELLNMKYLSELVIIVPFFSKIVSPKIKKLQFKINLFTLLCYLLFILLIFI